MVKLSLLTYATPHHPEKSAIPTCLPGETRHRVDLIAALEGFFPLRGILTLRSWHREFPHDLPFEHQDAALSTIGSAGRRRLLSSTSAGGTIDYSPRERHCRRVFAVRKFGRLAFGLCCGMLSEVSVYRC